MNIPEFVQLRGDATPVQSIYDELISSGVRIELCSGFESGRKRSNEYVHARRRSELPCQKRLLQPPVLLRVFNDAYRPSLTLSSAPDATPCDSVCKRITPRRRTYLNP